MPYRNTASGIASLGRYGDDTLVHMNRDEVAGLQALAMAQGGSLTINPYTGLPEAFSLKKVFNKIKPFLPTIAGAVTSMMGMGPIGSALVGGATGAATSKGNLLQGFTMGALGGWGGSGLATGLGAAGAGAGAGAGATSGTAGATSGTAGATSGTAGATSGTAGATGGAGGASSTASLADATNIASRAMTPASGLPNIPGGMTTMPSLGAPTGAAGGAGAGAAGGAGAGPTGMLGKIDTYAKNLGSKFSPGFQSAVNNPTLGRSGIAALMSASALQEPEEFELSTPMFQNYDYDPNTQKFTYLGESEEYNNPYAAAGGGAINDITAQNNYLASLSRGGSSDTDIDGFTGEARYANGGATNRGRYMKGPGDGVSDSIPAVINTPQGKRPAKLAAGEFVFPARVVAEIGNGSSDAGARELYAMMDRIERRMKTSRRGKDSGARKELIA